MRTVAVPAALRMEAWLDVADDALTMDDAETLLRDLGNDILERDDAGRRFKVAETGWLEV